MSSTSPVRSSASFLLMMLAAMSGIDSTVAVASRSAYIFLSAGAISGVWPIIAQPSFSICALRFGEREVGSEPGNRLELVERAAGVAERPTGHHRHGDAERRDERREHERDLVADAAGGVLVDARPRDVRQIEPIAAQQHRFGERRGFSAIEPAEKARHEQRGHLVVGHMALGVRESERAPLARVDAAAVALSLDQAMCEH